MKIIGSKELSSPVSANAVDIAVPVPIPVKDEAQSLFDVTSR